MLDFRLKVFYTVAQRLNFTKAANELFISQPAVSKHIKEIEKQYECRLFERRGNRLKLTAEGLVLKKHAAKILAFYKEMNAEVRFLSEKHHGLIKIGASTTASQYILPKYLADFKQAYPQIALELKTTNTENVEHLLIEEDFDIGIVEGKSKRSTLDYTPFQKDEIILCTHAETPTKSILNIEELKTLPLIIREKGSGTLEIIQSELHQNGLQLTDLHIEIELENNESIKSYLQHSHAFAFISISAILPELKHHKLKIIDVKGLSMERYYYFVTKQGRVKKTIDLFKNNLIDNQTL